MALERPLPTEYNPYFQKYLNLVPAGNFEEIFQENIQLVCDAFDAVPPHMEDYAYAPEKWTIKQMMQHLIDTDRVFSYRALVVSRADHRTTLFTMNENEYAMNAEVAHRSLTDLCEEFKYTRMSFYKLLVSLNTQVNSTITHVEDQPISARALGFISIGHGLHHISVLRERYMINL